jgi:hypothetical protein
MSSLLFFNDADPDPNFHVDVDPNPDPDRHQNSGDPPAVLPQVLQMLKNLNFFNFKAQHCHFAVFYLSQQSQLYHMFILDHILKFSGKKFTLQTFSFAWN